MLAVAMPNTTSSVGQRHRMCWQTRPACPGQRHMHVLGNATCSCWSTRHVVSDNATRRVRQRHPSSLKMPHVVPLPPCVSGTYTTRHDHASSASPSPTECHRCAAEPRRSPLGVTSGPFRSHLGTIPGPLRSHFGGCQDFCHARPADVPRCLAYVPRCPAGKKVREWSQD